MSEDMREDESGNQARRSRAGTAEPPAGAICSVFGKDMSGFGTPHGQRHERE